MKVLVTGAAGFIGRWVGEALSRNGHEWYGLDLRPSADGTSAAGFFQADICNIEALGDVVDMIKPEAIIHLAARCDLEGQTLDAYDANIGGVRNLCELASRQNCIRRVIYTSSQLVCEVGHIPQASEEYCPNTIYGQSKVRTEQIVRELDGGEVEWCLVRPTTAWGPGMSAHYQSMLRAIRQGLYFHSGIGALVKSYAYIANIAYQYIRLLSASKDSIHSQVFYLADYEPLSLRAYANSLQREMGARVIPTIPLPLSRLIALCGDLMGLLGIAFPYNTFRLRNIRTEYVFDLTVTEKVCGPLPVEFDAGVKETAKWFLAGAGSDKLQRSADPGTSNGRQAGCDDGS